jgi:hypothetical protein
VVRKNPNMGNMWWSKATQLMVTRKQRQRKGLGTKLPSQVSVAHTCNPSYSGSRDEEDCSSKPDRAIAQKILFQKNTSRKRAGGVAQGLGPEFKP